MLVRRQLTAGTMTKLFWPSTQHSQMHFAVNMPDPEEGAVVRLVVQVRVSMQRWLEGQHHHSPLDIHSQDSECNSVLL